MNTTDTAAAAGILATSIVSVVIALITGFVSIYINKRSKEVRLKIDNARKARDHILIPLREFLYRDEIDQNNLDIICEDSKKISEIIMLNSEVYFLVPPDIALYVKNLNKLILYAEQCDQNEWGNYLKRDLIRKYKKLQLMLRRFEQTTRKALNYPSDNMYETFRYHFGSPIFLTAIVGLLSLCWFVFFYTLIFTGQILGMFAFLASTLAITWGIVSIKSFWDSQKKKRYFRRIKSRIKRTNKRRKEK